MAADELKLIPKPREIFSKNSEGDEGSHYEILQPFGLQDDQSGSNQKNSPTGQINITENWKIVVDKDSDKVLSIARYLRENLLKSFALDLGIVKTPIITKEKEIILRIITDESKSEVETEVSEIGKEGYILEIFDGYIIVEAGEEQGIFYGVQTLLQLFEKKDNKVISPSVRIEDYPKIKFRGVHLLGGNRMNSDDIKDKIDQITRLKFNALIISSYDYFNMADMGVRKNLEEIFAYARQRYIEPIPEVGSFGVAGPILMKNPYAAEGIWVQDEHFRFANNEAVPLVPTKYSLTNVIRSEDSNIVVTNLNKTTIYKEGIDYKVDEGNTSYPYDVDTEPAKIIRIPDGNIQDGEGILVSYDYIQNKAFHKFKWSIPYCPSSKITYDIYFNAITNVINILHPDYISIGHDEIRGMNRDSRCIKRKMTNAELLADDINKIHSFVQNVDKNIKLMMWDDMLNPWHNGGDENYQVEFGGIPGKTAPAIDLIPKDIIMLVWWGDAEDWLGKMKHSPDYFELKGFDCAAVNYKDTRNTDRWIEIIKGREKCSGIIVTTWDGWNENLKGIEYTAEKAWAQ